MAPFQSEGTNCQNLPAWLTRCESRRSRYISNQTLDREDVEKISGQILLENLESFTGEFYRAITVNVWLATLTDEYGLVKRHESPHEDDWRLSKKGRRFPDLVIDDEFLAICRPSGRRPANERVPLRSIVLRG